MTDQTQPADEEKPAPFFRFMHSEPGGWAVSAQIDKADGTSFVAEGCITGADSEAEARAHAEVFLPQVYEPGTTIKITTVRQVPHA